MSEIEQVIVGALAGLLLGTVFFGGLWLTTKRIKRMHNVVGLVLGSFVGRSVITVVGFIIVIRLAGLVGIISTLVAFTTVQLIFIRLSGRWTSRGCQR